MGRIVAIAEGRCAAVAVAVRGVVRAAREVGVADLVGCLSRCAGRGPISLRSRRKPPSCRSAVAVLATPLEIVEQ